MNSAGYKRISRFCKALPLVAFWALLATTVWAQPGTVLGLDKVVLRLKWLHQFEFAGYYAAVEKGFYRNVGLNVEIKEDTPEGNSVEAVLAGQADFGIGGPELLLHRSRGEPVVALAAIYQHSPLVFLVPGTSDITNIHQLVGRRVMLEKHSAELLAYLRAEGLKTEDLEILPHTYGINELIEGKADAISAYISDETYHFVEKGLDYRVFTPQSSGIDFYGDVLFTSEDQIKRYPERVTAFIEATREGWKYALDHPEEIVEIMLSRYSKRHSRGHLLFEAEKSKALIGREVIEIGYMNPGRWRHIAEKYNELGMLPADVSLEGFIYSPDNANEGFWRVLVQLGEIIFALVSLFFVLKLIRSHFNLEELYQKNRIANRKLKKSRHKIAKLVSNMPGMAYKCHIDEKWTMKYISRGCRALTGYSVSDLVNDARVSYPSLIVIEDLERAKTEILRAIKANQPYNLTYRIVDAGGEQKWVWEQGRISTSRKKNRKGKMIEGFITDVSVAKNLEAENQRVIADLQRALSEIKVLRGIIPICSSCKKIRDDKGFWSQIEQYLKEHTDSEFSHSICPECAARTYQKDS